MSKKVIEIASLSDPVYFEKVFREYFKPLTYYAFKYTRDHDSAKEIVHTVFINLWEKRESFTLEQSAQPYLYTSVHNRCLNYLRNRARFHESDTSDLEFMKEMVVPDYSDIEALETESRINDAINMLPVKCRLVFRLNRFEEKKYREIAAELKISVKTVEAQVSKALRILREELKDIIIILTWIVAGILM